MAACPSTMQGAPFGPPSHLHECNREQGHVEWHRSFCVACGKYAVGGDAPPGTIPIQWENTDHREPAMEARYCRLVNSLMHALDRDLTLEGIDYFNLELHEAVMVRDGLISSVMPVVAADAVMRSLAPRIAAVFKVEINPILDEIIERPGVAER